jgi:hypothetical protein
VEEIAKARQQCAANVHTQQDCPVRRVPETINAFRAERGSVLDKLGMLDSISSLKLDGTFCHQPNLPIWIRLPVSLHHRVIILDLGAHTQCCHYQFCVAIESTVIHRSNTRHHPEREFVTFTIMPRRAGMLWRQNRVTVAEVGGA